MECWIPTPRHSITPTQALMYFHSAELVLLPQPMNFEDKRNPPEKISGITLQVCRGRYVGCCSVFPLRVYLEFDLSTRPKKSKTKTDNRKTRNLNSQELAGM